jgi:hypothetical protein
MKNEVSALDSQIGGDHYKSMKIQPIEFIVKNGLPFIEGNIVKYLCRWRVKGGIKDLQKVSHYLDILHELGYYGQFYYDYEHLDEFLTQNNLPKEESKTIRILLGQEMYKNTATERYEACKKLIEELIAEHTRELNSYDVLKHFACYLINDDNTNLTEDEIEQVNAFLHDKPYSHFNYAGLDETNFCTCAITGLKGDCMKLTLVQLGDTQ